MAIVYITRIEAHHQIPAGSENKSSCLPLDNIKEFSIRSFLCTGLLEHVRRSSV